jgi:hypothetical protein
MSAASSPEDATGAGVEDGAVGEVAGPGDLSSSLPVTTNTTIATMPPNTSINIDVNRHIENGEKLFE